MIPVLHISRLYLTPGYLALESASNWARTNASWPNGSNLWLGASGRIHGVVINGAAGTYAGPVDKDLLASGTWRGATEGTSPPANGSRVTATFEITSSS